MAAPIHAARQQKADLEAAIHTLKSEGRTLAELKARMPEQETRLVAIEADVDAKHADLGATLTQIARLEKFQADEVKGATGIEVGTDLAETKPLAFGEFLQGVAQMAAIKDGQPTKFGVMQPHVRAGLMAAASGASSGSAPDGGFLVRADWNTALLNRTVADGVLAPRCWSLPVGDGFDGIEMPYVNETSRATGSRFGGVQAYRAAEAASVTSTKPGFGKFELRLDDIKALYYATDRVIRDATMLEALVMKLVPAELAFKLDDEIVRGDGAGQCLGILNAPATVSVAKESGQATGTIVANNVIKMYSRMLASQIAKSFWVINQECLPQLQIMAVPIGVGGQLIYMPPGGLTQAPYGTLFGREVVVAEQASGLTTVGDIMFLSLADNYLLINQPMTSASSMHVRFIYDEMTYRWTWPIIGRPILQSAITPYKATSATTLSPFITLATR